MTSRGPAARIILIGLASLALAMGVGRFAFTPMLPLMEAEGLLGVSSGGLLASCHFLGYLMGAASAARVPMAPRAMLQWSLLLIGLTTLAMGLSDNYPLWLALRWLAGVASAWVLVLVSNYCVRALADGQRSHGQAWVFSGVGAGIALVGMLCLGFMAFGLASAPGWVVLGLASLLCAVVLCPLMSDELSRHRPGVPAAVGQRCPLAWGLVLAYGIAGVGYTIPATYLPVMARASFDSAMVFGWSWPLFGLAAFASTLLASRFQARYSNRQIWAAGQSLMALGLILPVLLPRIVAITIAGLCVGASFMVVTMVGMKEVHRIAPAADVMRHIGVMTTAFASGQIAGPLIASLCFAASGSLSASLLVTSALLLLSLFALIHSSPAARRSRV